MDSQPLDAMGLGGSPGFAGRPRSLNEAEPSSAGPEDRPIRAGD